ncbi:MAG: excinuclease ABC subunit UvrC [Candidatus Ranarchaeia archaeon]
MTPSNMISINRIKALLQRVSTLPQKPGVYLFRDIDDNVVYVGKAKRLRSRVRTYFHLGSGASPRVVEMTNQIADFEFIVTESEIEALVLECSLIKKHRPRYNIRFKDDKQYLYIEISMQERYPRLSTVRAIIKDNARYFGPNTDSKAIRRTLTLLRRLFKLRTCNLEFTRKPAKRPCLDYYIDLCSAPCVRFISEDDYRETAKQACLFLEGEHEELLQILTKKMWNASNQFAYEKASILRDQIKSLKKIYSRHRIFLGTHNDQDIIGVANAENIVCMQILYIRDGSLVGQRHYFLEDAINQSTDSILPQFLVQHYRQHVLPNSNEGFIPSEIYIPRPIKDQQLLQDLLSKRKGDTVRLRTPLGTREKKIMAMALENAKTTLDAFLKRPDTKRRIKQQALKELQEAFNLPSLPFRIEAFDVSTIQGVASVGSMITFENGKPAKNGYRRYKIRGVSGMDDFSMVHEIVKRRYKRIIHENKPLPDLILIDGGRGQLNAAIKALADLGIFEIPVIGIAKQFEDIYLQHQPKPLRLPSHSQGLLLLQHIRDEAHRFAVKYHRLLRSKKTGISLKTKKGL